MLTSLRISSYRFFDERGVQFRDLPQVVYLAGQNGSGKSSVLRYIFEQQTHLQPYFIQDSLSVQDIFEVLSRQALCSKMQPNQVFEHFAQQRILVPELFGIARTRHQSLWQQVCAIASQVGIQADDAVFSSHTHYSIDTKLLGGHGHLLLLIFACVYAVRVAASKMIIIESPESHLYPGSQKHIPALLQTMADSLDVQLCVATHSPFVLSGLAQLDVADNQGVKSKVYFLEQGRVVDKKGRPSVKAQYGYWGGKVIDIAARMLGSGLSDFVSNQPRKYNPFAPTLVLCEGEGGFSDARVYNRIFAGTEPPVTFIPSRGVSQLERSYSLLAQLQPGLSSEFELMMLRDRDHEFPSDAEVNKWLREYKHGRVLYRRALEAYIFTEEVAEAVMNHFGREISPHGRQQIRQVADKIQHETENGKQGDSYKQELEKVFHRVTDRLVIRHKPADNSVMMYLADYVTPATTAYQELVEVLGLSV